MKIKGSGRSQNFLQAGVLVGCVLLIMLLFAQQQLGTNYLKTQKPLIVYTESTGVR